MPIPDSGQRKPFTTVLGTVILPISMALVGACATAPPGARDADAPGTVDPVSGQGEVDGRQEPSYDDLEFEKRRDRALIDELSARDVDACEPVGRLGASELAALVLLLGAEDVHREMLALLDARVAALTPRSSHGRTGGLQPLRCPLLALSA